MDTLDNMRTFINVVKAGSFSAAARAMNTVPSVVAKRINQLEHTMKAPLFHRSTRRLELTNVGHRCHARFLSIVTDVDHAFKDIGGSGTRLEERLRIKCPTTLTVVHFGDLLTRFQAAHPGVRLELVLLDRSVNPLEEAFDVAIGALPTSYASVADIPLCPMPRTVIAAPGYLERAGTPTDPRDLRNHDCLSFLATGTNWQFKGAGEMITVDVPTNFSVNDSHVLLRAVEEDMGIAMLARHIARASLEAGRVVEVLRHFPVPDLWVKALVPENRRKSPAIRALLEWLIDACQPLAPWDRPPFR
ncbi:LysR family transcriptional regulator [Chelativorans sp. ZYF759]|uniref:LysR family transcriptional regulator n=1 Tax=Chelativorans sp. ZYF759 TaxID=2692213 RepID=UPI00145E21CD|nr:LysR family transcriptional regulator [Chelativorans sp. ZYF759]NMG39654.1 LysR family transcriptional regulator [Chelativorans sp. ZYF759]